MIEDLTKTLQKMLAGAPDKPLSEALFSFERPSEAFAARIKDRPTVNLFLYDIRENTNLRSNELGIERQNGAVTTIQPPFRVACSYLATAWSPDTNEQGWLQEHRLLSQILQVYAKFEMIPREMLQGALKDQSPLPPLITAMIDPQKNFSEFWTALGNRLRPSLTITATIAVNEIRDRPAKMVTSHVVRFDPGAVEHVQQGAATRTAPGVGAITAAAEPTEVKFKLFRVAGLVLDRNNAPVRDASVSILQMHHQAITDKDGRFELKDVRSGPATLRVTKGRISRDFEFQVPSARYDMQLFELP
jgi:hypothetical protein